MADAWYISNSGSVEGPLSAAELRDRAANGRLRPTDSVSADRVKWVPANSVAGLAFPTRPPLLETVVAGSIHLRDVLPDTGPFLTPLLSVSGYELLGTLGTGACGVVYKARQEKLNRIVAMKTVLMPDKTSREMLDRFKQEAVSLARMHHPNIVAVYDGGECDMPKGQVYFAMELLDGEDAAARLDRNGSFDEPTAWLIARQTAAALAHAATHGVIHRDIKPANLFLVEPPTGFPLPPDVPMVKVTDFGLALTRGGSIESDQRQTAAGVLLGTPIFMAPEQFTGSDVDPRADIYSLGATMYQLLSGKPPFDCRTVWEVMMRKSAPPPRLTPPISPESIELVAAMMANDAQDRPADYAALIARIDALPCLEGKFAVSGTFAATGRSSAPVITVPAVPTVSEQRAASLPRRPIWVYAITALALIAFGMGLAGLVRVLNRPIDQTEPPTNASQTPVPKATVYVPRDAEALYTGQAIGWNGQGVSIEEDEEKKPVLTIESKATRVLRTAENFRVVLAVDYFKASTVEMTIATTGDSHDTPRWLVRLDPKSGVVFGKQTKGGFEALAAPIPFPPTRMNQPPYLELKYERSGGVLTAWFDNKPLGQTPDAGLKTTEFRIQTTGGPVRIESAELVELVEVK